MMGENVLQNKCPHCGAVLIINKEERDLGYGAIVKRCKNCNQIYIDNSIKEAAITGISKKDKKIIRSYVYAFFGIGIFLTIMLILSLTVATRLYYLTLLGPVAIIYSLFSAFKEISTYKKRKAMLEQELINSKRRLANEQYREILTYYGIDTTIKKDDM